MLLRALGCFFQKSDCMIETGGYKRVVVHLGNMAWSDVGHMRSNFATGLSEKTARYAQRCPLYSLCRD